MKRIPHAEQGINGDDRARDYGGHSEKLGSLMYGPFLKDLKRLNPKGRCLEVGAGPAVFTCMLARELPGIHITALDISPAMVDHGRIRIDREGLSRRIDYRVGDAENLGELCKQGEFDLVYSIMSMHHWEEARSGLAGMLAAVKFGGLVYIGDLRRVWWLYYLPLGAGLITSVRAAYLPSEIKTMARNLGTDGCTVRRLYPYFYQAALLPRVQTRPQFKTGDFA